MESIFSPYRICPIGAHIDHQGGAVLGRTITLGTELAYEPLPDGVVSITSDPLGEATFTIGDEIDRANWVRYAQAAALVLQANLPPGFRGKLRGIQARAHGSLVGSGLSSSASFGLAFLKALADANGIHLTSEQLVELDFELEHDQLGLQNGLLDPLSIVYGQRDALLLMDTVNARVTPIPDPPGISFAWIVAFSGISRELTKSGFNVRVIECREAADGLLPGAHRLGDVPSEVYEARKAALPENPRKRAEHFFTEVERVGQGAQAWAAGDLASFGQLMDRSFLSSVNQYEVGSEALIRLHDIASATVGVYGSRFSGGGYGGCVVALAEAGAAPAACEQIAVDFRRAYPDLPSQVFVAGLGGGLR